MHGRRSLHPELLSTNDNIHRVNKRKEREISDSSSESQFSEEEEKMAEEDPPPPPMMGDFARPVVEPSPSCIVLPRAARNYELKTLHFNMLPSFHGMASEDPLTFMRDFYSIVQGIPLGQLTEEQLRMRCFPYTLKDAAKAWFMTLAPGSLSTWTEVYNKFIGKFYSYQKTSDLRTKIVAFSQESGEPFHEAWDRFKTLLVQCPHHGFPLALLNQAFYDGLTQQCQASVDNAAGGAMGEKNAEETQALYERLGANSQQKSTRGGKRSVYEVESNNELAKQVSALTLQVKNFMGMMTSQGVSGVAKVCAICELKTHDTNSCPSKDQFPEFLEQANAMNSYQPRSQNDPYSNTYNPGWRNHPNFSWGGNQGNHGQGGQFQQLQQLPPQQPRKSSLEDTLQQFIVVSQKNHIALEQRMTNQEASMKKIENQVGQIAEVLQGHVPGTFPSQLEQAKAATMGSGNFNSRNVPSILSPPPNNMS